MRENIHVSPVSSTGQTCTYLPQVIHVQAMLVLLKICVLMSYLPKVIQVLLVGVEAFVWVSVCPGQDYLNVQLLKQKKNSVDKQTYRYSESSVTTQTIIN